MRAYNIGLTLSDFSTAASTRTSVSAPEPPYNVTALFSRAEAKVSLSWSEPSPVPASYRVYRGTEYAVLSLLAGSRRGDCVQRETKYNYKNCDERQRRECIFIIFEKHFIHFGLRILWSYGCADNRPVCIINCHKRWN